MALEKNLPAPVAGNVISQVFSGVFGAFLGLALLKFPNPPIMAKFVESPTNIYEWWLSAWPLEIGYELLATVVAIGVLAASFRMAGPKWLPILPLVWLVWQLFSLGKFVEPSANSFNWLVSPQAQQTRYVVLGIMGVIGIFASPVPTNVPKWLLTLPLVWLGWQFVSATHTVNAELTRETVKHFSACVICFYLGVFYLDRDRGAFWFWGMLVIAFSVVIIVGFEQHFGGLEESRRYFYAYVYPQMTVVPPEYLKKLSSDRIFSTLFYPNSLAGALLLLLPATLTIIWNNCGRLTVASRRFLCGLIGFATLACLYWSGSKSGWLLMLLLGFVALWRLRWPRRLKMALLTVLVIGGLTGFVVKYTAYFERKATSMSARFDYWQAALSTAAARPAFGTGPGTFAIAYQKVKKPESEMARLAHNDYLQQASDSGVMGFLAYSAFVVGVLFYGRPITGNRSEAIQFAAWLGLLGWALQGLVEFGLYVPALAWCGFAMMGWLSGAGAKPFDNHASPAYPPGTR